MQTAVLLVVGRGGRLGDVCMDVGNVLLAQHVSKRSHACLLQQTVHDDGLKRGVDFGGQCPQVGIGPDRGFIAMTHGAACTVKLTPAGD